MYHFELNLLLKMFVVISLDYLFWCNAAEGSHFRNSAAVKGLFSLAQILFGLSRCGNCQVMFFIIEISLKHLRIVSSINTALTSAQLYWA